MCQPAEYILVYYVPTTAGTESPRAIKSLLYLLDYNAVRLPISLILMQRPLLSATLLNFMVSNVLTYMQASRMFDRSMIVYAFEFTSVYRYNSWMGTYHYDVARLPVTRSPKNGRLQTQRSLQVELTPNLLGSESDMIWR